MRTVVGAREGVVTALNHGLNGVARRQGNIFGFTIRKDLAVTHEWIGS